jgi:mRNA interferase MazF
MGMVKFERFDIYLVNLDPTVGHEIKKTRPAVIISPDEMNRNISTIIIAPMTTKGRSYPTRIPITFQQKEGQVILDQIRTVDKTRLVKKIGKVNKITSDKILSLLIEMFSK